MDEKITAPSGIFIYFKYKYIYMSTPTKHPTQDVESLIEDLGEITLDKVYDLTDKKNVQIRKLNLPNLVSVLVKSVLSLNGKDPAGNNVRYTADEKVKIKNFVTNFRNTVDYFMDFLDYDNDNQVSLVKFEKTKDKVEVGGDLQAFINDVKDVGAPFKSDSSGTDKVISTLTNVFIYLTSDAFSETKDDVINFNKSIKQSYASLKELKSINHKKVFASRVDDMVSFVIMFCVLLVPVIKLIDSKLSKLNSADARTALTAAKKARSKRRSKRGDATKAVKSHSHNDSNKGARAKDESSDSIDSAGLADDDFITNDDIEEAITDMYGTQLELILKLVDQVTKNMGKYVESSKFNKLKQKLCCCAKADGEDNGK